MPSTGVTITNPLVLYRSLLATQKIRPDPAQHRLALHLQKLYDRLIDYEPGVEYSQRLQQLSRTVDRTQHHAASTQSNTNRFGRRGVWTSLLTQKARRDSLAMTRVLSSHEEAMQLQSPKGLMLHGEVGTGKSMLIDLFQDCLPHGKKRRWHFNTFMLDTIARLEHVRQSRILVADPGVPADEYSLLLVARHLIETSPILFLDEFQLPDRAASKILSNLMTCFFQLGGVLIATSNRMPEELAKAAGMDFSRPVDRVSRLGWRLGQRVGGRRDEGAGQMGEFAAFLEVLRARCEVWEMEGKKDYRRLEGEGRDKNEGQRALDSADVAVPTAGTRTRTSTTKDTTEKDSPTSLPKHYLLFPSPSLLTPLLHHATHHPSTSPIPWTPATHTVYARTLHVPAQHAGVALFPFRTLCGTLLGPADYITLASCYHTFIITDVPVLRGGQKEEARRFITCLDALYEARCRLCVTAEAGLGVLFFPEEMNSGRRREGANGDTQLAGKGEEDGAAEEDSDADATHPETFSEIYQDLQHPFRPNISSYASSHPTTLPPDALEDGPPNRARRPGSSSSSSAFTDEGKAFASRAPDFAQLSGLTGADERFAVQRAESRVWEMCSARWWDGRGDVAEWWRPVGAGVRFWEKACSALVSTRPSLSSSQQHGTEHVVEAMGGDAKLPPNVKILSAAERARDRQREEDMFRHGASPFRVHADAPPRFGLAHAWAMVRWGKRAGAWGKGVEGLEERVKEKAEDVDVDVDVDGKGR